ncbi:hypothetical protein [Bacillus thermotolerans]|uniref:hypothetical protein n=1 Tax=Bacillus thermotolerans TaxID=1221996 RepID=UPI00057C87E3|nr:hypothetical protein [Bacillus thermotolerans]KKB35462.1 hypothetical protein QY97_01640 [Bacillus thermotolerans]
MIGIYSILPSLILLFLIAFVELAINKRRRIFNSLSVVNITFAVCYALTPMLLMVFRENIELALWMKKNPLTEKYYLIASIFSLIGYVFLVLSYLISRRVKMDSLSNFQWNKIRMDKVFILNNIFGLIGLSSLMILIIEAGGVLEYLQVGIIIRNADQAVLEYGFLTNIVTVLAYCAFLAYGLFLDSKSSRYKRINFVLFILYASTALLVLFNRAGRLSLILFFITFIIIRLLKTKKLYIKSLALIMITFYFFTVFGKRIFHYFVLDDFALPEVSLFESLQRILLDFSFPFFTLANAIKYSFFDGVPRLFIDFYIGIFNLIPNSLISKFGMDKLTTETELNTASFGGLSGIPVDFLSLGYYSFGLAGILITCIILGSSLAILEKIFANIDTNLAYIFYFRIIVFIALFIPYAGPTNLFKNNFMFIILGLCLMMLAYKKKQPIK